ncbi:MAG: hypothetical protein OXE17_02975 [Chloroflexi bacterium]|nr:hypothetical protein [Chloroflexota bacterium]
MQPGTNQNTFRFAVKGKNDITSNSWIVWVEKDGSAYVSCRKFMGQIKASLHASGQQQVAFTSESKLLTDYGDRFLQKTTEPQTYTGPTITPSYSLFFPSWALSITSQMRQAEPGHWAKHVTFIQAAEEPLSTTLSFCIIDSGINLDHEALKECPISPIKSLALRPGKRLWVVKRDEKDDDLKKQAISLVEELNGDATLLAGITGGDGNEAPITLRCDGKNNSGIPYTMSFPVSLKRDTPTQSAQLVLPFTEHT